MPDARDCEHTNTELALIDAERGIVTETCRECGKVEYAYLSRLCDEPTPGGRPCLRQTMGRSGKCAYHET